MTTKHRFTMKAELLPNRLSPNPRIKVKQRQTICEKNMSKSNGEDDDCNNCQSATPEHNLQQQVRRLKEMVILQLDLIHHQQEQLAKKEKQLQLMKKEKQVLKLQIEKLEKHDFLQKSIKEEENNRKFLSSENNIFNSNLEKSSLINYFVPHNINRISKSNIKGIKRQFNQSETISSESSQSVSSSDYLLNSDVSFTKINTSFPEKPKHYAETEILKECLETSNSNTLNSSLETEDLYYLSTYKKEENTNSNSSNSEQKLDKIQVPSWRFQPLHSCYQLEGTENIDDDTYYRRHFKLEIDEKRRKRWDIQRIREQRKTEKLKHGRINSKEIHRSDSQEISSFYPAPTDILCIEVTDTVPVLAFGHPIPQFQKCDFTLPWFDSDNEEKYIGDYNNLHLKLRRNDDEIKEDT